MQWLAAWLVLTTLFLLQPLPARPIGPGTLLRGHRRIEATLGRLNRTLIPTCFLGNPQPWSQVHGLGSLASISSCWNLTPSRGEGWVRAMPHLRAETSIRSLDDDASSAKIHGIGPVCWGTFKRMHPHSKRSFRRAKGRALRNGFTWYRGKLLDRAQLGCSEPSSSIAPPIKSTQPRSVPRDLRKRIHVLAWNSTGLAAWKLDELRYWLAEQPFQVVLISETRWQFDREWIEGGWIHIACSGEPFRSCGMLFMIRTTLCQQSQVSWRSIVAGRLIHVRLYLDRPLDLIGCYQHVYVNKYSCKQNRMHWIRSLDSLLHEIPNRNNLVLLGDWNCGLPQSRPHIGTSDFLSSTGRQLVSLHEDWNKHLELVRTHDLCAINTWRQDTGPTCQTAKGDLSRIDYIFVRTRQTDRETLECMPLESFDLLGTAKIGPRPLIGSLNLAWRPSSGAALNRITYQSRVMCRSAQQDPVRWSTFLTANTAILTEARWTDVHDVRHTQDRLTSNFQQMFNRQKAVEAPWNKTKGLMATKWDLLAQIRKLTSPGIASCFRCWHLITAHHKCHVQQQLASRQARKDRFDLLISEARFAASRHDLFALHAIVRKLSPKVVLPKINLRGSQGELLSPVEAFAHLKHYVCTAWAGPQLQSPTGLAPGVPFSEDELTRAFARLNIMKSTAPGTCPNGCLKAIPHETTAQLYPLLQRWWSHNPPFIPQQWKDGSLFLLPKPGKPPDTAANLRPLALQDPLGTTILGLLTAIARNSVLDQLCAQHQYAYLPHRGTHEAISRAADHCQKVRALLHSMRRPPSLNSSNPSSSLYGGLTISIDLKRAFDSLPRPDLFDGLRQLGVDGACVTLLQEWHVGTRYWLEHKGHQDHVSVALGVRQGCRAAPFLWASSMSRLMTRLAESTSPEWVLKVLTLYADDFLLQCQITCEQDLWDHLHFVGILFDILDTTGLSMNLTKTVALLQIAGKKFKKLQSRVLVEQAHQWFLLVPRSNGNATKIKLVADLKYLGCKLSYGNFEKLTLEHRVAAGLQANRRLHRWLYGKKGLDKDQRRKLWESVVRTTMTYGIWATGVTLAGLKRLVSLLVTMQRMIYMNHSHRTRDSHTHFFQQNQIEHPLQFLHRCCLRILTDHTAKLGLRPQTDVLHRLPLTGTRSMLEQIEQLTTGGPDLTVTSAAFECRTCGVAFSSIQALLTHEGNTHRVKHKRVQAFSAVRDSVDGTSICRHCHHSFPCWNALRTHIEHASCPLFDPLQVMSTSLANARTSLQPLILEVDPTGLSLNPCIGDYLRSHCILCGTQLLRFQDMTHHLALEHASLAAQASGLYQHWHGSMLSPCTFCHVDFAHTHHCKVLFQLMVLRAESLAGTGAPTQPQAPIPSNETSSSRTSADGMIPFQIANTGLKRDGPSSSPAMTDDVQGHQATSPLGAPLATSTSNTGATDSKQQRTVDHPTGSKTSYENPSSYVCIICACSFATQNDLAEHMKIHDTYHSVRDAVMGHPTCSHCRSSFRETWELQRHIVRKSCPVFDPQLQPTGALCFDPDLQAALREGTVVERLLNPLNPEERLRFTLSCTMCGMGHSRVADLTRHLQTQHGPFYRSADAYVLLLEEHQPDCVCNPRRPSQPRSHRCVAWRQVAMIEAYLNPNHWSFYTPWKIEADSLQRAAQINVRLHAQAPQLLQRLDDPLPARLLMDRASCESLRHHCSLCNRSCSGASDLMHHIEHQHAAECQCSQALLHGLVTHFLAHSAPLPCMVCDVEQPTYNLVDQSAWLALKHKCVVLQNLALLYLLTRPDYASHGGAKGGGLRRGQANPAAGDILRYARRRTDSGPTTVSQEAQGGTSRQEDSSSLLDDSSSRRLPPDDSGLSAMPDAGGLGPSSRGRPELSCLSGPVHPVSHSWSTGHATADDPDSSRLERAIQQHNTSPSSPDDAADGGTDETVQRFLCETLGRGLPSSEHPDQSDPGGQHDPLPEVVSSAEMSTAFADSGSGSTRHGAKIAAPPLGSTRTEQSDPLLRTPKSRPHYGSDTMEDSALDEERCPHVRDEVPSWLSGVDAHSRSAEGTLPTTITCSPGDSGNCLSSQVREPPTLGDLLRGALLGAQLCNNSCWCWANAGLLSTLWALLCRQTFSLSDFGPQLRPIRAFLHVLQTTPGIQVAEAFSDLFQQARMVCAPRDVGEFVSELIVWLETEAISMTWERRFAAGTKIVRSEAGTWQFPLALDCIYELDIPNPTLQQLLNPWIYAESMRSGFLSAGPLTCVYVDRLVMLTNFLGHNNVLDLEQEVNLPFFEDDRTAELTWLPHRPVSGVVHLGSQASGHFVTFLKASSPDCWYEMDDEKPAKVHSELPDWAKKRLALIWLCPANCALDKTFPTMNERLGLTPGPSSNPPEEVDASMGDDHAPSDAWTQLESQDAAPALADDAQRLERLLERITEVLLPPETCELTTPEASSG